MSVVEVTGLRKQYPGVVAVSDVSFTAAAGEVTAVLGPNGAGKTTTIEIGCGLRRPDGGTVRVLGRDPVRDAADLRTRVGVMPQAGGSGASGVYPAARVGEVLRLFASLYDEPLPVTGLVDRLGLGGVMGTAWRRLSGGEQQRLSLALAVIGRPEVLFLDEPTAGLDVAARRATWQLVRDLRAAGVAVLLSTHAMQEAEQLADRIVIIAAGRVVASGTPAELTSPPESVRSLTFSGPPGLPVGELALPGAEATEPTRGHYLVTGRVDPDTVAAVTAWCAARGVMPEHLTTGQRTLEDVFLEVTGQLGR